jgi:ectoine hydroxylase-related dioxygenase (phytanoyl-CoA dioxygenase family)
VIGTSGDRVDWQHAIQEHGYAIISGVFSAGEIIALVVSLADLIPGNHRAGVRHVLRHPAVTTVAHEPRLLGIARAILGSEAFPFRATLFDKSPGANWLVAWHQDTAVPLVSRQETPGWGRWSVKDGITYAHAPGDALNQVLALRLHLDDSTPLNGPLRVLPGTHILGVLTDDQVAKTVIEQRAVECVVPRGGLLAMRPSIIHASSKSQSPESRRVLHIEYAASAELGGGLQLAIA